MSKHNVMNKSQGRFSNFSDMRNNLENGSDVEKDSLFSKSTNIRELSELVNNTDIKTWNSSTSSLNLFSSELSKSELMPEENQVINSEIEEEKDDDLERDTTMEVDDPPFIIFPKPVLRKRPSAVNTHAKVTFERENFEENGNWFRKSMNQIEVRKERTANPAKKKKMKKFGSDFYSKLQHSKTVSQLFINANHDNSDDGEANQEITFEPFGEPFSGTVLSRKKRRSIIKRNLKMANLEPNEYIKSPKKYGKSPRKDHYDFQFPLHPTNPESVDDKLYKDIPLGEDYQTELSRIGQAFMNDKGMNTITCDTVSDFTILKHDKP